MSPMLVSPGGSRQPRTQAYPTAGASVHSNCQHEPVVICAQAHQFLRQCGWKPEQGAWRSSGSLKGHQMTNSDVAAEWSCPGSGQENADNSNTTPRHLTSGAFLQDHAESAFLACAFHVCEPSLSCATESFQIGCMVMAHIALLLAQACSRGSKWHAFCMSTPPHEAETGHDIMEAVVKPRA